MNELIDIPVSLLEEILVLIQIHRNVAGHVGDLSTLRDYHVAYLGVILTGLNLTVKLEGCIGQ